MRYFFRIEEDTPHRLCYFFPHFRYQARFLRTRASGFGRSAEGAEPQADVLNGVGSLPRKYLLHSVPYNLSMGPSKATSDIP